MKKRMFRSMCAVALLGVLLTCLAVTGVLYRSSLTAMKRQIRDEAVYLVALLNHGDQSMLETTRKTTSRVTLVDGDGTVLFDSVEDAAGMENHLDRPEIEGAVRYGASETDRTSETLSQRTCYRAVRLEDGRILRVAGSINTVWTSVLQAAPWLTGIALMTVILATLLARVQSRRIAEPINQIDLEHPMEQGTYEELAPLMRRIDQQHRKIDAQLKQLTAQQLEFTTITDNMREGLILLGRQAEVLSINRSALSALGITEADCIGKHILSTSRDSGFLRAVEQGLTGHKGESTLLLNGRHYQMLANPVSQEGEVQGTVVLLLDITDRQEAEQVRREFTANVSHELKTPLTSISGFAEIIRDGMVEPGDIPRFAGRIHTECRRLIALVEDIIRLSRLDEGHGEHQKEPVDLYLLAREVADRLTPLAEQREVMVTVEGAAAMVQGERSILDEMVANLVDNAIKYNKPGGTVCIRVEQEETSAVLTVEDSGVGIPKEHQERVFERFYRVDKSHSKETGGTGLGLSIVKHAARFHGASLALQSEVGKGTKISITFPGIK